MHLPAVGTPPAGDLCDNWNLKVCSAVKYRPPSPRGKGDRREAVVDEECGR